MVDVDISHLFVHTLVHKRIQRTRNSTKGTISKSSTTVDSTVKGRVVPATQRDIFIGQREEARVTHGIYLAPSSDVRRNDTYEFDGRSFRVVFPNITPSKAIYQKVLAEEVQRAST